MSEIHHPYTEQHSNEFAERNMRWVTITSDTINIGGEEQAAFDDGKSVYLFGPMDQARNIGVFKVLEYDSGKELKSGGYLSCAEISGEIGQGQKFIMHALNRNRMIQQIDKILELSDNEKPRSITIRLDQDRADLRMFKKVAKESFGNDIEIEVKTLLDP